ncbi:MAG: NAD(P)/FAD-dependent oxidoreductase [Comamonas sp.]
MSKPPTAAPNAFDAIIIGAGAAGLFCAGLAGQAGLRVLLIDHAARVAEKIRISGGGRCNFTNRDAGPAHFLGTNPRFCRSALARYPSSHFIELVQRHRIPHHEKHKGQLFCDDSSESIIRMLLAEADQGGVQRWQPCAVQTIEHRPGTPLPYRVQTERGEAAAAALVIATGGLSIPKIGATDFGHRIARQFSLKVTETRPALAPLTFDAAEWQRFVPLAGLSLPVRISCGKGAGRGEFLEDLLFTHRGLSGPAVLQISSFWLPGQPLHIDLAPHADVQAVLLQAKRDGSRRLLANELAQNPALRLPARLADAWVAQQPGWQRPVVEASDKALAQLAESLARWAIVPNGTEGYRKAEATLGGVDTRELSSQTMEATRQPGLYFIGEVIDVTGWLGGYNFQWAWASAHACATALAARP